MPAAIIFASTNAGKLVEARRVAQSSGIELLAPDQLPHPRKLEVVECGVSYLENAALKADACFKLTGIASLGDDSGLEISALCGAPGLISARYAGVDSEMSENRAKVLEKMKEISDRSALFRCVLFLRVNSKCVISAEETLAGSIAFEERGLGGFGYDSIIEIDGYAGKTLAELKAAQIEVNTHRLKALSAIFKRAKQLPPDVWPRTKR